jgi:hypothetical protein
MAVAVTGVVVITGHIIMRQAHATTVAGIEAITADTMVATGVVIAGNSPESKRSCTTNKKCLSRGIFYL